MLIDGLEWCGLRVGLLCFLFINFFNQLFGLSFWRHPFTAEDPLVSKWCNAKCLQIYSKEEFINQDLDIWMNAGLLSQSSTERREHRSVLLKDMWWILSWTGWSERCNRTLNTCFCWGAERWHSQGQSWLLLTLSKYKTDLPPLLLFSA